MSAYRRPRGLGRAGGRLWDEVTGSVAEGWMLDGRDLELLQRACGLADSEAALRSDVTEHGRIVAGAQGQPVLNPAVREARMTATAIAAILTRVQIAPPLPRTGQMSKRQRDQLADARRQRWPKAS